MKAQLKQQEDIAQMKANRIYEMANASIKKARADFEEENSKSP